MGAPHAGLVLVTRPEPGASVPAQRLTAMGYAALVSPVLVVDYRSVVLPNPGGVQAILLTSAAALPALSANFHHLPVLAVGMATAAAARHAGFGRVLSAAGAAADLLALVGAQCDPRGGSLLFPGAADLAADIVNPLRAKGFRVVRRVVYRTRPAGHWNAEADAALRAGRIGHVLFFSPASARAFVALARHLPPLQRVEALAISASTAQALAPLQWRRIRVACRPNQDELLALLP